MVWWIELQCNNFYGYHPTALYNALHPTVCKHLSDGARMMVVCAHRRLDGFSCIVTSGWYNSNQLTFIIVYLLAVSFWFPLGFVVLQPLLRNLGTEKLLFTNFLQLNFEKCTCFFFLAERFMSKLYRTTMWMFLTFFFLFPHSPFLIRFSTFRCFEKFECREHCHQWFCESGCPKQWRKKTERYILVKTEVSQCLLCFTFPE